MLMRKRGETHQQFIKRLEFEIQKLTSRCMDLQMQIVSFSNQTDLIPVSEYESLKSKYTDLKNYLISLNLYTGRD